MVSCLVWRIFVATGKLVPCSRSLLYVIKSNRIELSFMSLVCGKNKLLAELNPCCFDYQNAKRIVYQQIQMLPKVDEIKQLTKYLPIKHKIIIYNVFERSILKSWKIKNMFWNYSKHYSGVKLKATTVVNADKKHRSTDIISC